jgi:hypothetical protein
VRVRLEIDLLPDVLEERFFPFGQPILNNSEKHKNTKGENSHFSSDRNGDNDD